MKRLFIKICAFALMGTAASGATLLPLYNGLSGVINVPGPATSFDQSGFQVTLLVRPSSGASSTSFYFGGPGGSYAYGAPVNSSEVDITQIGGGVFQYNSIQQWAFQGSSAAVLTLQGYLSGSLVGTDVYSLSTPNPGNTGSFTSVMRVASAGAGGLSGVNIDKLVILPDFTTGPTQQAGFANLTVTVPEPGPSLLLLLGFATHLLRRRHPERKIRNLPV